MLSKHARTRLSEFFTNRFRIQSVRFIVNNLLCNTEVLGKLFNCIIIYISVLKIFIIF